MGLGGPVRDSFTAKCRFGGEGRGGGGARDSFTGIEVWRVVGGVGG